MTEPKRTLPKTGGRYSRNKNTGHLKVAQKPTQDTAPKEAEETPPKNEGDDV